ncbi:peptidase S10 [Alsobacter soli]|uniref:Peptidase S10 n=1 Tax=Alsobacter soli TaxID=2109933 RepID=A0A2T1HWS0_9HYPH|nr:peptidase S10 [Alsobacter soli]PSC06143.1 peptidase S10 [Alsobacter soli]
MQTFSRLRRAGSALCVLLALGAFSHASLAWAQQGRPQREESQQQDRGEKARDDARKFPADSTTEHTLELPGRTLKFTATLGSIPLYDGEGGPLLAEVGFIAFQQAGGDPARRPVTFAFNGGPGAASAYLNLAAVGPWRVNLESPAPSAPAVAAPNPDTWLDFTDLVFIDPVGTGYSWSTARGDDLRRRFWSVDADIQGLATVIRKWVEKNGRQASPKVVLGESYGGYRAPRLARELQTGQAVGISGVAMLSPVLDFAWRFQPRHSPMRWVTELPSMAAANMGSPDPRALEEVERYAAGEFMADLLKGPNDQAAVDRMTQKVSSLTGLDAELVRKLAGRVDIGTFVRERQRGRLASVYDATISGYDPQPFSQGAGHADDPVLDAMEAPLSAAATALYRRLGWKIDRPYHLLNREVSNQWQWGGRRSAPEALGALRDALALDPNLKAIVAHGATDLVTPYFENKLLLAQLPKMGSPDRLRLLVYPGGHMFYTRDEARGAFRADAQQLFRSAQPSQ